LGIILNHQGRSVPTFGIVDSGADDCVFPLSLAGSLQIITPNQRSYVFSGAADNPQLAFFEKIEMVIWDFANDRAAFTFELDVGFTAALDQIGAGLLGQNGFFSRFRVTMDHENNFFDLERIEQSQLPLTSPSGQSLLG
jgi:hypothetical protein